MAFVKAPNPLKFIYIVRWHSLIIPMSSKPQKTQCELKPSRYHFGVDTSIRWVGIQAGEKKTFRTTHQSEMFTHTQFRPKVISIRAVKWKGANNREKAKESRTVRDKAKNWHFIRYIRNTSRLKGISGLYRHPFKVLCIHKRIGS